MISADCRAWFGAVMLVGCGGTTAPPAERGESEPTAAEAEVEAEVPVPPDANAFIPGFALQLPERGNDSHGIRLKSDDEEEELNIGLALENESIDSIAQSVGETMGLIARSEAPISVVEVGGHPARMVTVMADDGGHSLFSGFVVASVDGRTLRLAHQSRDIEGAPELLERVMQSFSAEHPGAAPPGFIVVGVGNVFFEAPSRLTRANLYQHYPDAGGLELWIGPVPADGERSVREGLTESRPGYETSNVETRPTTIAGLSAEITDVEVNVSDHVSHRHLAEAPFGDGRLLWVQANDLPEGVSFEDVLATIHALP
jgi:hypothetical protein